jgi:hypothetical protein
MAVSSMSLYELMSGSSVSRCTLWTPTELSCFSCGRMRLRSAVKSSAGVMRPPPCLRFRSRGVQGDMVMRDTYLESIFSRLFKSSIGCWVVRTTKVSLLLA